MAEFSFRNVSKSANVKVSAQLPAIPIKLDSMYVCSCWLSNYCVYETADAINISYNAARTIIACSLSKIAILNRHENSLLYTCAVYEIGTQRTVFPTLSRKYDLIHNRQIEAVASGIVLIRERELLRGKQNSDWSIDKLLTNADWFLSDSNSARKSWNKILYLYDENSNENEKLYAINAIWIDTIMNNYINKYSVQNIN